MLNYKETKPLPEVCRDCQEEECYNCDYCGDRWKLTEKSKLLLERNFILKEIERLEIKKYAIDIKLKELGE